ncbi:mediator complex, subunit Med21 [Aspergillus caelatus]|uniref:Mediator of RNA polymerase II transcription subunit 21 n=1 Tax=Aspergillus caelatus TaxID=61420 RepID=A0A5N6ZLW5_9EURO|nr:mediator complex, subunit Med21 [Aspergillus caelatus]KAE8358601.1 mediator complex, subunit Med21 [Aspergillus caelatus]
MADILTQLQTCLDQLATQFYATVGYLVTYHDNSPAIPPQNEPTAAPALAKITKNSTAPPAPAGVPAASQASPQQQAAQIPGQQQQGGGDAGQTPGAGGGGAGGTPADPNLPPAPDSPRTFASRQRELARDLVIKEQQIEYLISVLPGIDSSEAEQERKIKELEKELRSAEEDREQRVRELRKLRKKLENVLGAVEVGIYGDRGVVASRR